MAKMAPAFSAPLDDVRQLVEAPQSDLFDVLSSVLFTNPPKTRVEKADNLRSHGFEVGNDDVRELLLAILQAYQDRGESELATTKLGTFLTARFGSVNEGKSRLGGLASVKEAFRAM